jgi:hypothetical protein
MFVQGGFVREGAARVNSVTTSVLKYDCMLGTWIEVAPMPGPRYGMAACAVVSAIYVFGGRDDAGG